MSFSLPANIVLPTSPERHHIAIAEIAIFAALLSVQLGVRHLQIRRHARARGDENPLRCFLKPWLNYVVVFALIRIAGFALYLGVKNPGKTVVIVEVVLQSIGLSPLLLELAFMLIRCGRAVPSDKSTTSYPKFFEMLLQCTRLLVAVAVALIIVAGSILNLSFLKAGAVVLLATFIYVACIVMLIVSRYRQRLDMTAQVGLWIAIASFPLYTVRVIYFMLVEFGNVEFDPVIGAWRYLVCLGFTMEVGIVILLILAGVAVEPWWIGMKFDRSMPRARSGKSAEVDVEEAPPAYSRVVDQTAMT